MTTPASRNRKSWRCFHCDEVFRTRKAAWAHFGPDQYCEKPPPGCVDPLREDEKARLTELREAQEYAFECQELANAADDRADQIEGELAEFKTLTKCDSVHALRMAIDSAEGELITARTLINAVREKAPEVYAEVIQWSGDVFKYVIPIESAMEKWRESFGLRADGKPNRPLTAWTVAVED
jgi:hypothetical protein